MKTTSDALYAIGLALAFGGIMTNVKGVSLLGIAALVVSGITEAAARETRRPSPEETAAFLLSSLNDEVN